MYCSIVSAIASTSSSSEYSWSESRLKSVYLNSSRLRVLKCLLDDRNSHSASVPDDRYAVSNGSGYAVLISLNVYVVLDYKMDTPYLMEVDTPYREYDLAPLKLVFEFSIYKVWKSVGYGVSKSWIRRIQELDTAYWGFLGVGTTLDIFQNIILIPYLEYGVLSPLDTAY
ncbi:hypothetical protein Tco_0649487 [Tanacetum coccineum]